MISEADTLGKPMQMRRVFRVSLLVFAVVGLISSLIMFLFPTELAVMMDEVEAAQSIFAISPAIFLVCLAAAYRGYAQGQSNMKPTTVSQVLEVVGKVAVGLVLAWYLTRIGKSLPVASGGAIFGVTAGSLLSLVYMMIYKRRNYPAKAVADPDVPEKPGTIVATLLRIGIPITLGSCVMSLIKTSSTRSSFSTACRPRRASPISTQRISTASTARRRRSRICRHRSSCR